MKAINLNKFAASNIQQRTCLDAGSKLNHSFECETDKGLVEVSNCSNRGQARKLAQKAGYEVYSVNFTG